MILGGNVDPTTDPLAADDSRFSDVQVTILLGCLMGTVFVLALFFIVIIIALLIRQNRMNKARQDVLMRYPDSPDSAETAGKRVGSVPGRYHMGCAESIAAP